MCDNRLQVGSANGWPDVWSKEQHAHLAYVTFLRSARAAHLVSTSPSTLVLCNYDQHEVSFHLQRRSRIN